jgi:hypothetical protein
MTLTVAESFGNGIDEVRFIHGYVPFSGMERQR